MAANPKKRAAGESIAFLVLIGAILVVANIVATNFPIGRFDLTRNQVYSLSQGSRNVMGRLEDTLTVRVYFTDNLPAEFADTERQVRDLLAEYKAASRGRLVVRYIRPDNEERQQQAERDGVQKVQHTVLRNDAREQVDGYRGLALEYRGETKALPVIAGSEGLEYQITMLIRQLLGQKYKVGILANHGATAASGGPNNLKQYLPNFEFVDVDATSEIPNDIRALIIAGASSEITEPELRNIDRFVLRGGSLGVFGGTVNMPEQPGPTVDVVDSHINTLLDAWGVHVESNVVADQRCTVRQSPGYGGQPQLEYYPVWPVVMFEPAAQTHPATYHLNETLLAYASTLKRRAVPSGVRMTVLAQSSEASWQLMGSPIAVEPEGGQWVPTRPTGPFPLIVALEGRFPSAFAAAASTSPESEQAAAAPTATHNARVLVVGSASPVHEMTVPPPEALRDPRMAQRVQMMLAFVLNSMDWLANDSDLVAIRSKTIDAPALAQLQEIETAAATAGQNLNPRDAAGIERARNQIESMQNAFERKKKLMKFGMTLGLPLLVVLFGVVRWRLRLRVKAGLAR